MVEEASSEAYFPAKQPSSRQAARISPPDVDTGRPGRRAGAPAQGTAEVVGLIWRIRDRRTFVALRSRGMRVRSGSLTITFLAADAGSDSPPQLAFAITRRVGQAVVRNLLRRRLQALFVEYAVETGLPPGAYLVSAAPVATELSYSELRTEVRQALRRLDQRLSPKKPRS